MSTVRGRQPNIPPRQQEKVVAPPPAIVTKAAINLRNGDPEAARIMSEQARAIAENKAPHVHNGVPNVPPPRSANAGNASKPPVSRQAPPPPRQRGRGGR